MFTIRGSAVDLRRGWTRRDCLRFGLGGAMGLVGAASAARADAPEAGRSFGRAKSCILVYLFGGPSHIDIWDMKPDAVPEIRGEFKPIATNVPGVQITEHLPRLARLADQYAIIRSLAHGDNAHGSAGHTMLTGRRPRRPRRGRAERRRFSPLRSRIDAGSGRGRTACRRSSRCRGPSPPAPTSSPARTAASSAASATRSAWKCRPTRASISRRR